jgi:DNA-binding SARP family transcriptional activator
MLQYKITAPELSAEIVQRERLFCLLEKSSEKPVKWISGPGGSGKTTLVSSYLESRQLPALWYQIDQRDADPGTFFYYLGLAFRDIAASNQEPLPLLTPEYLAGFTTFTRRYFETLFTQLPVPYTIVLDNYQDVSPSSPFHELITQGFSLIPDGITIIILSRNEPPPVLSLHETAKQIEFIGWNDIRFSFDESRQFAEIHAENTLETETLARLYTKTDGWIAGLLLILESLKGGTLEYQLIEHVPLDKVFDYFAEKIFDRSDRELQFFLLKTAFVPGITGYMSEQLTGIASSEQILSRLCRNRFFTEKRSPDDSVYQYHPLFRKFLISRAENTFSTDEIREIRRTAAALLLSADRTEEAADLLLKAADWDAITELILNTAPIFAAEGRSETVYTWLTCIPEETVEKVAGLLYWKGICLLLHSPPQSRILFRKAFDLHSSAHDKVGMLLSWSGGTVVSLYDGEFTPLDEWLSLLEEMHVDDYIYPSQQLENHVTMSIFNAMAFRQPHHPDIARWRDRATTLVRGSADINFRLQSAVHLLVHDLWNGNFGTATFMLEQTLGLARSRKISPMTHITIMNAHALHAFFTGAWELGGTVVVDALRIADETGVHVWDNQLLASGASCAICRGDLVAADYLLKTMENRLEAGGKKLDIAQYHGVRGWQESLRNDFSAACRHLEPALNAIRATGFLAPETTILNGMVESLREMGEVEQAGIYLSQAYTIACDMGSRLLEFLCLFNSALLALDASDEQQSVILLHKAMALGSAEGYVNSWFWRPASLLRLCVKALENDIEVDYVRGLIRRWELVPETPPLHIDTWPWPLRIKTLGTFELLQDGQPVVITGKVKKPLELLKTLIGMGAKNVPQDRLADALWPDADGDLALRSFVTTLHRLRKLLGNEKVLQLQSGRLSINPRLCWIDTWAFERQCGQIEDTLNGKSDQANEGRLALSFEKTASLYNGSFLLDDTDQTWTVTMREHMRSRFLHLLESAGGYYEAQMQWEKAAEYYRKGLQVDSLAEEFYQRLMICNQQLGLMQQAVKTYQRCRSALSAGLALPPSLKTEEIYADLVKCI